MIETILIALGLVFVLEWLVFALAPSRIEELLRLFASIPLQDRRAIGLGAVALGAVLVWIATSLG